MSVALGELAVRFGCELRGDPDVRVESVASLGSAQPGTLSFLANPKLAPQLEQTRASAVVLDARSAERSPVPVLISSNPHALFARIALVLHPEAPLHPGIHPTAVVDPRADIDPTAEIGAHAVIGAGVRIGPRSLVGPASLLGVGVRLGADCRLVARVTLGERVQLGDRVLIHPGAVLGADGFGYAREGVSWLKVPQIGTVRVGDDVEIGANTTIDRGALDETRIGRGTKLDNLIHIGHNCSIGRDVVIAAQTGISGSSAVGDGAILGGQVGMGDHAMVGPGVILGGQAGILPKKKLLGPGIVFWGTPAKPVRQYLKELAMLARLKR